MGETDRDDSVLVNEDTMVSTDGVDAGNESMNVDDAKNTTFEDIMKILNKYYFVHALYIILIFAYIILFFVINLQLMRKRQLQQQIELQLEQMIQLQLSFQQMIQIQLQVQLISKLQHQQVTQIVADGE